MVEWSSGLRIRNNQRKCLTQKWKMIQWRRRGIFFVGVDMEVGELVDGLVDDGLEEEI